MKIIYSFLLASSTLGFISCGNGSPFKNGPSSTQNYEQNKMSLEDQEKSNPTRFLSSKGTYREEVFGHKKVIEGTITNKATVATFKDVVLHFTFLSRTQTIIGTANYVIYDFFLPNQTKPFNFKIDAPGGTATLGWEVGAAVPK